MYTYIYIHVNIKGLFLMQTTQTTFEKNSISKNVHTHAWTCPWNTRLQGIYVYAHNWNAWLQ